MNKMTPKMFWIHGRKTPVIVPRFAPFGCVLLLPLLDNCSLTEPILSSPSAKASSGIISSFLKFARCDSFFETVGLNSRSGFRFCA